MSSDGGDAVSGVGEAAQGRVPKLRFPEFRGAAAWSERTLADLCLRITNGKANAEDHEEDGTYPLFDRSAVIKRSNEYSFEGEAVILPGEGMRFQPRYFQGRFNLHQRAYTLMEHQGDARFVFQSLDLMQDEIARKAVKSTVLSLRLPIIQNFSLLVPSRQEQHKIADCLSSLDEVIATEGERLAALRDYKKGLMQALLPAPGQATPRLRFPEFQNAGEWAMADLPEVAFFQEGPGIMAVDFCDEGVPLVRLSGVSGMSVTLEGCNYLDPSKVSQKWPHFRLEIDDLVISTSATFGLVATVTDVAAGAVFYTGLIRFRPHDEQLDRHYLKTFLGSEPFARQVAAAAVGGGIKHFGPTHLKQMTIPLPQVAEQNLVAKCLNSVDELIAAASERLDAIKAHKSGLMQQLFPSPAEASA